MSQPTSDIDLLQRFTTGDQEAFAVLVARHQGVVLAACTRQALPGEREDCVQAVFLVLARRPQAAIRAGNLPGWLVRVAWFVCHRARRAAVRRQRAERAAGELRPPATPSADSEALFHLDDCLQRLPTRQRSAVTLHYLASQPVEEVASQLGVSRDNAYQLLSRGLAGLRGLLARRGVALSTTALGALLAGQAQAATTATAAGTAHLVATLSATPSPATLTLAHGAMTAMTIATATPVAAGLVLALGLATAALTAEAGPKQVAPGPVATVPSHTSDDPAWRKHLELVLEQEITLDFKEQDLAQVVDFLRKITGANLVIDSQLITTPPPPITLKVEQMKLKHLLGFIMRLTDLSYTLRDGAIAIVPAGAVPADSSEPLDRAHNRAGLHLEDAPPALRDKLLQRITLESNAEPVTKVLGWLQQVTGLNIVVSPRLDVPERTVTLRLNEVTLQQALTLLAEVGQRLSITVVDDALYVSEPAAETSAPGNPPAH